MPHPETYLTYCGIETRYHGPTNFKGARVSARYSERRPDQDPIVYLSWDDSLNSLDNHVEAAKAFVAKLHKRDQEEGLAIRAYPLAQFVLSHSKGYYFALDWNAEL